MRFTMVISLFLLGFPAHPVKGADIFHERLNVRKFKKSANEDNRFRTRYLSTIENDGSEGFGEDISDNEIRRKRRAKSKKGKSNKKKTLIAKCAKSAPQGHAPPHDNAVYENKIKQRKTEEIYANENNDIMTIPNETATIKYKYSVESANSFTNETEMKLKSSMFVFLSGEECNHVEGVELDARLTHRRRLEVLELKSPSQDKKSGNCTPQVENNTCTEYDGEIIANINKEGMNSNINETRKSVISSLELYTHDKIYRDIDSNIVGMAILTSGGGSKNTTTLIAKCTKSAPQSSVNKSEQRKTEEIYVNERKIDGMTAPNETTMIITYKYSLELAKNITHETKLKLKSSMFVFLSGEECQHVEDVELDAHLTHRRRLEVLELESPSQDRKSGYCTPQDKDNKCIEYDGEIIANINMEGVDSSFEETRKSVLSDLKLYTQDKIYRGIDSNIVDMTILTKDSDRASGAGSITGMVAGVGFMLSLLYGM